ncbi:hypothetical protein GY45DRAFT_1330937 [Cubamyces sp. BRFM 1775]|nr:hypothetical protein GY45DRAFT_1330937 [Cubamyces sp. BRFM 1775]
MMKPSSDQLARSTRPPLAHGRVPAPSSRDLYGPGGTCANSGNLGYFPSLLPGDLDEEVVALAYTPETPSEVDEPDRPTNPTGPATTQAEQSLHPTLSDAVASAVLNVAALAKKHTAIVGQRA